MAITSLIFYKFQMKEILDKLGFGHKRVKARFKGREGVTCQLAYEQEIKRLTYMCMLADTTAVIHVLGIK